MVTKEYSSPNNSIMWSKPGILSTSCVSVTGARFFKKNLDSGMWMFSGSEKKIDLTNLRFRQNIHSENFRVRQTVVSPDPGVGEKDDTINSSVRQNVCSTSSRFKQNWYDQSKSQTNYGFAKLKGEIQGWFVTFKRQKKVRFHKLKRISTNRKLRFHHGFFEKVKACWDSLLNTRKQLNHNHSNIQILSLTEIIH